MNLSSSNNSGVPKSKFRYANKAINIAANLAPGIPNNIVGIIEVAFCELFAPSGPMTPLILPLPKGIFSFGLVATVCPYAIQSEIEPPSAGSNPITAPISPPRSDNQRFFQHSINACLV